MNRSSTGRRLLAAASLLLLLPRHPGVLTGHVTDESGQPISGADVALNDGCRVLAGPEGQFTMLAVEHGEYLLHVTAPGFEAHEDTLTVAAGDTTRITVTLSSHVSRQERDSLRARRQLLLSLQPDSPTSPASWIRSCH